MKHELQNRERIAALEMTAANVTGRFKYFTGQILALYSAVVKAQNIV